MSTQPEPSEPPWWSKLVLAWAVLLCVGLILAGLIWTEAVPALIGDAGLRAPPSAVARTPAPAR